MFVFWLDFLNLVQKLNRFYFRYKHLFNWWCLYSYCYMFPFIKKNWDMYAVVVHSSILYKFNGLNVTGLLKVLFSVFYWDSVFSMIFASLVNSQLSLLLLACLMRLLFCFMKQNWSIQNHYEQIISRIFRSA